MKIICLAENTPGNNSCTPSHGLSFYIETARHRLLMDTGPSDLLIENAALLNVDLTAVDTVILSHGHYDHGGGLAAFSKINPFARIYVKSGALNEFFSEYTEGNRKYIGLNPDVRDLSFMTVDSGTFVIDDELMLFGDISGDYLVPSGNKKLKVRIGNNYVPDDFSHEMCLVISQGEKRILLSGCAHHGILNILSRYRDLFDNDPDIVISGFHMMQRNGFTDDDIHTIIETARELSDMNTRFYTCHCTGAGPYEIMKLVMKDSLHYIHCGDVLVVPDDI